MQKIALNFLVDLLALKQTLDFLCFELVVFLKRKWLVLSLYVAFLILSQNELQIMEIREAVEEEADSQALNKIQSEVSIAQWEFH